MFNIQSTSGITYHIPNDQFQSDYNSSIEGSLFINFLFFTTSKIKVAPDIAFGQFSKLFCMSQDLSSIDRAKYVAARRAADLVQDGMRVGLGTGSTAAWLVRLLGAAGVAGGADVCRQVRRTAARRL